MTKRSELSSVHDVLQALQSLGNDLNKTEHRRIDFFNQAYVIITRNVHVHYQQGNFQDIRFLDNFDAQFARYYINALNSYLQTGSAPTAWVKAFQAATDGKSSAFKCMALGVNAHVNNDIPQVLADTNAQNSHYSDFKFVDDIIKDSIYEVLATLPTGKLKLYSNCIFKPFYKLILSIVITYWRHTAWQKYQKLSNGTKTIDAIESNASLLATGITLVPRL